MSTLKDRIIEIQAKMGWDDDAMAAVAGVSRSAVAQWRGQGSKLINSIGKQEAAESLSRATGLNALWIAKGKGPRSPQEGAPQKHLWPLPSISEEKIRAMNEQQIAQLEAAILIAAGHVGLDVKRKS